MEKLELTQRPVAKAEILIRKPVKDVFEAIINPEITSKFWFTKGSGRLETGKQVTWKWEMYNISIQVKVLEIEENKRILMDWGAARAISIIVSVNAKIVNNGLTAEPSGVIITASSVVS